jgi:hypothetical protein
MKAGRSRETQFKAPLGRHGSKTGNGQAGGQKPPGRLRLGWRIQGSRGSIHADILLNGPGDVGGQH